MEDASGLELPDDVFGQAVAIVHAIRPSCDETRVEVRPNPREDLFQGAGYRFSHALSGRFILAVIVWISARADSKSPCSSW